MTQNIVGEIYLNVLPKDGGVSQGVQRIIDNANNQAANIPVSADTEEAEQAVARLGATISEDVGGAWLNASAQAATFTVAVLGARRAIEGTVGQLAGIFDQLAQAQAGFTAILGSEQGGSKLLDEIREFARESPFVTQELVNYSQQLLGVGQAAESIVPLLRSTGDLIASVGGDTQNISRVLFTLTQIRSIGRLVGQDAIQLQSALIPITKLLADFLGVTTAEVKKLQEQGAISADTVFAAITNAGNKVEGAMANATRNISGARAVLSDTVEIMFQDAEVLRRVFDDIVEGILNFSEALGDPAIQTDISAIFDGLDRLYTTLQPVLEGLSSTASQVAISSLQILASTLEILAGALESIPTPILELVGRSLAVMVTLKAPLALLNYVTAIQRLAAVITPASLAQGFRNVTNEVAAQGRAAEVTEKSITKLTTGQQRLLNSASAAAVGVGLLTSSLGEGNEALATLGQTLTTAGIGAQLGSAFGAPGVVAGAGIGAGFGLINSFVTSAREEQQARQAELEEIGKKAGEAFFTGFQLANPEGFTTTSVFDEFFAQTAEIDAQIGGAEEDLQRVENLMEGFDFLLRDFLSSPTPTQRDALGAQSVEDILEGLSTVLDTGTRDLEEKKAEFDALFAEGTPGGEAIENLRSRLAALSKESPGYVEQIKAALEEAFPGDNVIARGQRAQAELLLTGQAAVASSGEFDALSEALAGVDSSVTTILTGSIPELALAFSNEIPSALKETRDELTQTKTAFDEAKKAADEFYNPFQLRIDQIKQADEQSRNLSETLNRLIQSQGKEGGTAFAENLLKNVEAITAANQAVFDDQAKATAAGLSFANAQFDALQRQLRLTDDEFQNLLRSMGLLELFLSSQTAEDDGFVGTIVKLSNETGIAESKIRDLLDLSADLDRSSRITVSADVVQALAALDTLQDQVGHLPEEARIAIAELERQIRQIIGLGGGVREAGPQFDLTGFDEFAPPSRAGMSEVNRIVVANRKRAEEEAARLAEQQRREAERLAAEQERLREQALREQERLLREQEQERQRLNQAIESAGDTIANAIDQAANSIEQAAAAWTNSIRDRTQFERALSADRLIGNTQRQVADLEELNAGISALSQRGLSSDAQGALGIDNVADLRQVRRLLQADPAALQRLSGLVAQRDATAELLARRAQDEQTKNIIVAAIVQAADILGFEMSPERALQISAQFDITGGSSGEAIGQDILNILMNAGRISRG